MSDALRVQITAAHIADELKPLFAVADPSSLVGCIVQAGPTYGCGLTNGEAVLATLRALALLQIELMGDPLCDLKIAGEGEAA